MDLRKELPFRADYAQYEDLEDDKQCVDYCNACKGEIEEYSLRFAVENHLHCYGRKTLLWHHFSCFFDRFRPNIEEIAHYAQLRYADQNKIRKAIKRALIEAMNQAIKDDSSDDNLFNGSNCETRDTPPKKKRKKRNKSQDIALKRQSDLIYKNLDFLQTIGTEDLIQLLEYNKILVPKKFASKCDRLADAMSFGRLNKCPECRNGQLVFRISGYICSGYCVESAKKTKWIRCHFQTTATPERRPFKVPKGLANKHQFLNQYRFEARDRIYIPALIRAAERAVELDSTSDSD